MKRPPSPRRWPTLGGFMKGCLVLILALALSATSAQAQCVPPFEQGTWFNIDPGTRGITKVVVDFSCNDVVHCSVDGNGNVTCDPIPPPYQLHLWGKCSPSD